MMESLGQSGRPISSLSRAISTFISEELPREFNPFVFFDESSFRRFSAHPLIEFLELDRQRRV